MQLISIQRTPTETKIPVYVASQPKAADLAARSVAAASLKRYGEELGVKVVPEILDETFDFKTHKNSIVARFVEHGIEIVHVKEVNKGYIFNDIVVESRHLGLIRIDEIPEFLVIEPIQVSYSSDVMYDSNVKMASMYPALKKDSQEHAEFMGELKAALRR